MPTLGNPLIDNPDQRTLDLFNKKMSALAPVTDVGARPAEREPDAPLPFQGSTQTTPALVRPAEPATLTPTLLGGPKIAGPLSTPAAPPASPLTRTPLQEEGQRLTVGPQGNPGVAQIHNPWLRGLAHVGDALATGFFPKVAMAIPGTTAHHNMLVNLNRSAQQQEEANATGAANRERVGAEIAELGARGAHETAETDALKNPKEKPTNEWVEGTQLGIDPEHPEVGPQVIQFNKNTGEHRYTGVKAAAKPTEKAPKEADEPLGDSVNQINAAMKARYQVLHQGAQMPAHYILPKDATHGDFARIDKLLEGEEKAFGTKANQEASRAAREQAQALAQANRNEKGDAQTRQAAFKAYSPALDSGERFNVMSENYERAVKNHDQQAMLSLLANHLGMTMGLQKGARLNQAIISEAQKSLPWLQGLKAKFGPDGYMTGVTLSPGQMHQMLDLGRSRFSEDLTKGRNEARYLGANDEGPERTPNRATIDYYMTLSGDDLAKAKQLARADGWTVK